MHIVAGCRPLVLTLLFLTALMTGIAADTHVWEQSDPGDFARGTRKNISVRKDGRLTLAPEFKELDSTGVPYLWAVAQDSKGNLFYGGGAPTGATTKVFEFAKGGKPKTYAELNGLEVHALAIDKHDAVYAAVLPDAKIYKLKENGKPELFFDPKCKYIWAMAFDGSGNLLVATGDSGLVYKVSPEGKGAVFFDTKETHARSIAFDDKGDLIVGTEPGGLIFRITAKGEGFVVYQANRREVTAVAARNGMMYAAAIGSKPTPVAVVGNAPTLPTPPAPILPTGLPRTGSAPPSLPPAIGNLSASVSGGSELYRIGSDGATEKVWSSATDLVYAVAFDASGRPLLATGNKGVIYRVDSDVLSTELVTAAPTQVTSLLPGQEGVLYATTGNVGNLYAIGPNLAKSGSYESEPLDAGDFSYWGRAHITGTAADGEIELSARSGNLNNPQNSWSPWTAVEIAENGGAVHAPAARFLQYRLTLTGGQTGTPEVSVISLPYLPKNLSPKVLAVELAPYNYRQAPSSFTLERPLAPSGSPASVTIPAVGQRRSAAAGLSLEAPGNATLQYNKGYLTARWNAADPNGDPLLFKVEIREVGAKQWLLLKDKLQDRFYAFDTATLPDGQYVIRVTADDSQGNTRVEALSSSLESDPFFIDNTPPEITNLAKTAASGQIRFTARDSRSWIDKAEYSVDGGEWQLLEPVNKVTDSQNLDYEFKVPGMHTVAIRVFDEDDNFVVKQVR